MRWILEQRLTELQFKRPRWIGTQKYDAEVVSLLGQLAATGDARAISAAVPFFLLDSTASVQAAAARAIHEMFSRLQADQLLRSINVIETASAGYSYHSPAWSEIEPSKLNTFIADPATCSSVLGLASLHRNGYVRQKAVQLLSQIHDGSELPFLIIRLNDWVEPIRFDVRAAIDERLTDDYLPHFVVNMPLVVHLLAWQRSDHSAVVRRVIAFVVELQRDRLLRDLIHSPDRTVRRAVVRGALELDGAHIRRVIEHGLTADDATIRLWCATPLRSLPPADGSRELLATLRRDPSMPVRREVMRIEADLFPELSREVWQAGLLDANFSIRELSQILLARFGDINVADLYRQFLIADLKSLAALSGLGEVGDASDLPKIREYLSAPLPRQRKAALRGLARIAKESAVHELIDHIRDDSIGVVREVCNQMAPWPHLADGELLLATASDDKRGHVRAAALKLLVGMGKWEGLPWLIRATGLSDQELAARGKELVEAWFSPPLCNRNFTQPSSAQREALRTAIAESKPDRTLREKLERWINEP